MATEVAQQSPLEVGNSLNPNTSFEGIVVDDGLKKKTHKNIIDRTENFVKKFEDPDCYEKKKLLDEIKSNLTWTAIANVKVYNMDTGCMDTIAFWKKMPEEMLLGYEINGEPYLYGFMYDYIYSKDKTDINIPLDQSFVDFCDDFDGEIREIEIRLYSTNETKKGQPIFDIYTLEDGGIIDLVCDKNIGIHVKNIISLNYKDYTSGRGKYNSKNVKKSLCNNWKKHGSCRYGDKCQFKHN